MDGATERGRFMQAMLAQLELLMRQGRGGSCGERKAYKARLQQKVIALYEQTEPPSGAGGE